MGSETHDNLDLVLGAKTFVELEAELNMRELKFKFLNRKALVFPVLKEMAKPNERRFLKVEAFCLDNISGWSIIKLLRLDTYDALTRKVKFERNKAVLEVTMIQPKS